MPNSETGITNREQKRPIFPLNRKNGKRRSTLRIIPSLFPGRNRPSLRLIALISPSGKPPGMVHLRYTPRVWYT